MRTENRDMMQSSAASIHKSRKGTKIDKEKKDHGFNYPNLKRLSARAGIIKYEFNLPFAPTMDEMLDRDQDWDDDVDQQIHNYKYQLDAYPDE